MCISVSTMYVWFVGGSMGVSVVVGGWVGKCGCVGTCVWVCGHVRVYVWVGGCLTYLNYCCRI